MGYPVSLFLSDKTSTMHALLCTWSAQTKCLCEHGLLTEQRAQGLGLFLNRHPRTLDSIHISVVVGIRRDPANVMDTTKATNVINLLDIEVVPLEVVESCTGQPPLGLWVLGHKALLCLLFLFRLKLLVESGGERHKRKLVVCFPLFV